MAGTVSYQASYNEYITADVDDVEFAQKLLSLGIKMTQINKPCRDDTSSVHIQFHDAVSYTNFMNVVSHIDDARDIAFYDDALTWRTHNTTVNKYAFEVDFYDDKSGKKSARVETLLKVNLWIPLDRFDVVLRKIIAETKRRNITFIKYKSGK